MDSEIGRFPRLFRAVEIHPRPHLADDHLPGRRCRSGSASGEVRIMHIGRGHTAGDIIAFVPDANVVFSGDLVEYQSACYCGDAHFTDWPATLDRARALSAPRRWCPVAARR